MSKLLKHIITADHSKKDLRYTQKPIYLSIFTYNIWSYLLCPPVISAAILLGATYLAYVWGICFMEYVRGIVVVEYLWNIWLVGHVF